jgi:hypothetical protein
VGSICVAALTASAAAQRTRVDVGVNVGDVNVGVHVETRGPVHEAFAEPVVYEPQPGLVVPQPPPDPIQELPPEERPAGDYVNWVPGYWSWDDDDNTYIWTSGIWRSCPPGRAFVPGYWTRVSAGFQWVSGFWIQAEYQSIDYLPPPPRPLSLDPIGAAPAPDYIWVPGVWIWRSGRYVWRPGYWLAPQVEWTWVPSHYVWTPSGFVFVSGYWDYTVTRRGLLFAPVRVERTVIARPGFVYTPRVVVNTQVLVGNLFARPRYAHYYFGDYFAPEYARVGIVPVYAFQRNRHGYSSIYAQRVAIERRRDPRYEDNLIRQYEVRRDRTEARPPRTWSALEDARRRKPLFPDATTRENLALAQSVEEVARGRDAPLRIERTPQSNREDVRRLIGDVRKLQDRRRQIELESADKGPLRPARTTAEKTPPGQPTPRVQPPAEPQPLRLSLPRSPLAGRRSNPSPRTSEPATAEPRGRGEPRTPRR